MKSAQKMYCAIIAGALFFSMSFSSCQKESVIKPSNQQTTAVENEDAAISKTVGADGITKLVLRPCDDGQDTYITFWNGDANWANSVGDWAQEL